MRKFIGALMVIGALVFLPSLAKAEATSTVPSNVYFFGDGKGYDENQDQKYFCFGTVEQSCYSLEGVFAFVRNLPAVITDLQNRISNLENQPVQQVSQPLVSGVPTVDTAKANRVKGEISTYISELNGQINEVNNSFIPMVGLNHFPNDQVSYGNKADGTYRLEDVPGTAHDGFVLLENYPNADRIPFKDLSKFPQYPAGFPDNARKFVTDSQTKLDELTAKQNRLNIISYEIDDYLSAGILPSAEDRAYLQSLGINW